LLVGLLASLLGSLTFARDTNAGDMWLSGDELARLPAEGPAWDAMRSAADETLVVPDLAAATNRHDVITLARALVAARLGLDGEGAQYRRSAADGLLAVIGTESGETARDPAVNMQAYVLAADLIDLADLDTEAELRFRTWVADLRYHCFGPRSFWYGSQERPNNWGLAATAARLVIAIYLRDHGGVPAQACLAVDECNLPGALASCGDPTGEIDQTATLFRGWLGDRSAYSGFQYGSRSWQANPTEPVGINAGGATIAGYDVDGVLPDDQRRAGPFRWPPPRERYVYEGLQSAFVIAAVLDRQGFDAWNWEDRALKRAFDWLHLHQFLPSGHIPFPARGDDQWLAHLVNHAYGTRFPSVVPAQHGKNAGWTDWTHAGTAQAAAGCGRVCDDGNPCNGYEFCDGSACRAGRATPGCIPTTTTSSTTSTTSTTLPPGPACGDATGDGEVTVSDAAAVLNVVVGAGSCEISVCDVDRDGLVTVSDALTLLRFAAGVIPSLPCQAAAESDSGLTPVEMKCAVRWLKLENLCSAEARR
jgi:hypothetical protein